MPAALSHCGCRDIGHTYIQCNYKEPVGLPQWLQEWNDGWAINPARMAGPNGGITYTKFSEQDGLDCSRECLADQL
jgi:hypothetical protein